MGKIKRILIKAKESKVLIWGIIIILLLSFNAYRKSPYTYKKEHRPLNYALKGHRRNFKTHYVRKSESDKKNAYHIQVKNKANAEEFIEIILSIEEYLAKSPDHQPSDYTTEVIFRNTISGKPPILKFSNAYSEEPYKGKKMDGFYEMVLYSPTAYTWYLSEFVDIEHCRDLESMVMGVGYVLDNVEDLKKLTELKYFEIKGLIYSDFKEKDIKENLPEDCKVFISYK
ncbi:MAG TPA: hypothetical protein GX707_01890 [Epulopiscium sp.]|nr:hypothetical protein [Candidatus Epulonipiscium sp.]